MPDLREVEVNDPGWRAEGHEGSASTYTMSAPPPAASTDPPFPVASWDRYSNVRFLGQGGMGKVYLAVDNRLRREVAIKFVRGDDAEHVRRLIAEARTQARVNHDRICKVFEVDEVEGKVYIAMQYIRGKPLGQCAAELTLEQKVMLVRAAAEGIHEAHRVGIVHRDIKPSNIMVERGDDGELRPYVMDFGLAHSAQEAGATQTGAVLGTPRYMAPEQAHGSAAKLDRRADVYSLGATLYHLVTGEPPVPGETMAEVIANLVTTEPRPLRAIDPTLPIDLEAIVLKCLEKERSARYDSARALADDLGRFLNGEPVVAHPADAWYRLRKRLVKHRRLVAASAAALVVLAVAIGWAIKTSGEAAERERLARRFTEKVERIEAMARYSALSPLHDIRGDRSTLRDRMTEIETEIRQAGEVAAGPGHYALGRGYLALNDDDHARSELESAWHEGFHEPQAAYALALVMGHLYQHGLVAAERIEDRQRREAEKRKLEEQFRRPALDYLAASRGAETPSPEYVAALVAFYGGDSDAALGHLDKIGSGLSWFYEAQELRGDILFARAVALGHRGEFERARRDFDTGRKAYAAAAAIGESVAVVPRSLADLEHAAMVMELYGNGDVLPPLEHALAATARTLAIVPDDYDALVLEARIRRTQAEYGANQGSNVEDELGQALRDAERAKALFSERPQARLEIAQIYRQWADSSEQRHQDPLAQLHKALDASEAIAESDRDAQYYANLGLVFTLWADHEAGGAGAQLHRDKARDAFTRALQLDDTLDGVRLNLGINWYSQAQQQTAAASDEALREALKVFEHVRVSNPRHVVRYFYEGQINELMAQRARERGVSSDDALASALRAYQAGLAINDRLPHLLNGIGSVLLAQARAAWDRGGSPEALLDQAADAFRQAIAKFPDSEFAYDNLGEVLTLRAWYQRARGEDPGASVAGAVAVLNQAIRRVHDHPTFWADLGMAHAILAGYQLEHGKDPEPDLGLASEAIDRALKLARDDAQSRLYLGEVRGLYARLAARQGRADGLAAAAKLFENAIAISADNQDYGLVFGQFCRAWAEWQQRAGLDPGTPLRRGLELTKQLLARHPHWPDAQVLQGSLTLLQAQGAPSGPQRKQLATAAVSDLSEALTNNAALSGPWDNQFKLAQQLAK